MPRRVWLGVFLLALLLRVIYLVEVRDVPFFYHLVGDAERYWDWAGEILHTSLWGNETFYQAPLYPYLLALLRGIVGDHLFGIRIVQALWGAVGCGLIGMATERFVGRREGLCAGLLLALYPPAIFFDGLIQKTSLGSFLLCALLALLVLAQRKPGLLRLLAAGVVAGLLAITRENALVLSPIAAAWILGTFAEPWRGRWALAGAFVGGVACILMPVGIRNAAVGGTFAITTVQMGPNFFIGNHEGATGRYVALVPGHESPPFERDDARAMAESALQRPLNDREVSRYWMNQSWDFIGSQPGSWLRLIALKGLLVWNRYEIPDTESYAIYRDASFLLGILDSVFHFGTLAALSAMGVILTLPKWRSWLLCYGFILFMTVAVAAFFVLGRYRFPLVPMLVMLAGAGLVGIWDAWRNRELVRVLASVVAAAGMAALSSLQLNPESELNAMGYLNLGTVYAREGDIPKAAEMFRRSAEGHPDAAEPHYNLGLALALMNRHAEAVEELQQARAMAPNLPFIDYNLAVSLERTGDVESALRHYAEALRANPEDERAQQALERLGQR